MKNESYKLFFMIIILSLFPIASYADTDISRTFRITNGTGRSLTIDLDTDSDSVVILPFDEDVTSTGVFTIYAYETATVEMRNSPEKEFDDPEFCVRYLDPNEFYGCFVVYRIIDNPLFIIDSEQQPDQKDPNKGSSSSNPLGCFIDLIK